jgi:hypothetical protein
MSDFLKQFLRDDFGPTSRLGQRRVFLAAFGKHRGWTDFMDDLGLETQSLITAKRLLYSVGIKSLLDGGHWKKLQADECLPRFNHAFLWTREKQWILGRLWYSSDGGGRDDYPMTACIHGSDVPFVWALENLWPRLRQLRKTCQAVTLAADVQEAFAQAATELLALTPHAAEMAPAPELTHHVRERFVASPEWGLDAEGLLRILHLVRTRLSMYATRHKALAPGTSFGRLKSSAEGTEPALCPQSLRVPACSDSPSEALWQWADFFLTQLDCAAPMLLVQSLDGDWVDVIVGEPSTREFFALRATSKAIPLASEVPYSLDESARHATKALLAAYRQPWSRAGERSRGSPRPGWVALLIVTALLLFGAYLRFAPKQYLPRPLGQPARWLGNPAVAP